MVTIDELDVGKCYTRWDDAEYLILYKTDKWIAVLHYSDNHKVANLEFWSKEELNKDYNEKLVINENDWPITEYINEFEFIDWQTISNK